MGWRGVSSRCSPNFNGYARRGNVHFVYDIFYELRISGESRKRFEAGVAFRAVPNMSDKPIVQILRLFGRNQLITASNAASSEHRKWVEQLRHYRTPCLWGVRRIRTQHDPPTSQRWA